MNFLLSSYHQFYWRALIVTELWSLTKQFHYGIFMAKIALVKGWSSKTKCFYLKNFPSIISEKTGWAGALPVY